MNIKAVSCGILPCHINSSTFPSDTPRIGVKAKSGLSLGFVFVDYDCVVDKLREIVESQVITYILNVPPPLRNPTRVGGIISQGWPNLLSCL